MTFIQQLVKEINQLNRPFEDLRIVVPSKRAIKYIKEELADSIAVPVFAPEITTIHEWITDSSKYRIAKPLELILELYKFHLAIDKESNQTFSQFYNWGRQLIADFDEIDRYLVNPNEIYRDLRNIKEIENWSFNSDELSEGQNNFLEFWLRLKDYYRIFNENLSQKELCYAGQAFKKASLAPNSLNEDNKFVVFAGFNALSLCEEQIVKFFINHKQGKVIWDTDALYWENKNHEAGHFIRKFYASQKRDFELPNHLKNNPEKIEVFSVPNEALQAQWCAQQLIQAVREQKIKNTALILANENLLIPILNNLPQGIGKANITLGMPLKKTGIRSLLHTFFEVKSGFERFKTKAIYYKFIQQFIQHPFIQLWLSEAGMMEMKNLENNLVKSNSSFLNGANVKFEDANLQNLFDLFFKNEQHSGLEIFNDITAIFTLIYEDLREKENPIQAELCYLFLQKMNEMEDLIQDIPFEIDLKTLQRIIDAQYQSESISFFGSPTKGLQIMGVLESRLLDFEHIIVVGMNEGSLPTKNISSSMIPMDLKMHHGLPTPHEKEAIFSHHFYRLMHRAKSMSICFSTDQETNAEKSRYLRQIEYELPRINPNLQISNYIVKTDISEAQTTKKEIHSSAIIQEKLDEIMTRGISPSAINNFRTCKKNFYYRYILGLKEKESLEEQIESSTFGTIVHAVLEELYKPFVGKQILVHDVEQMQKKVDLEVNKQFKKYFPESAYTKGKNRLSFNTTLLMVKRFLKQEITFLSQEKEPVFIIALEEELAFETEFQINGAPKKVKFKGNADRIDRVGDKIRIIDYKTGACKPADVKFGRDKSMESLLKINGGRKFPLQLLLYFYMFKKNKPQETQITSGIISLRNSSNGLMNVLDPTQNSEFLTEDTLIHFEEILEELIQLMYEPKLSFEHNETSKYCEYC